MKFVNTSLDESILKSFDAEHPSEELVKAMSKQGLVQKEVQVKGKNGQTFTRKQWVKAGEDQPSTEQPKAQEDAKETPSKSEKKEHWTKVGTSQEAKAQIAQMLASGKSREDCMTDFKSQGVTWKEHENPGINWMRATMAMNKHLTSGAKDTSDIETNKVKEENVETSKEVLTVRDALDSTGTATTTSKEIADMYKNSKNSNKKFDVKINKDGSYTISSEKSKETKSVIGTDYTQLASEKESGTIEGEAHNIMVGKLGTKGKKKPTEKEIKSAANELKDKAVKTLISSYNQDEMVHQLAMAKQFTKLAGDNMDHMTLERIFKDALSSESKYSQEQKCHAMSKLLGSSYTATSNDTVARYSNKTDAAVDIRPLSRGNFEVTFTYGDGEGSTKETYDSIDSVKKATDKWIDKEDSYYQKDTKDKIMGGGGSK